MRWIGRSAVALLAGVGFMTASASVAISKEVGDYRFQGSLVSSAKPGKPLKQLAGGVQAYGRDAATACAHAFYEAGAGFRVQTAGMLPVDEYTIAIRFRSAPAVEVGDYSRLINFRPDSDNEDDGLYFYDNDPGLYVSYYVNGDNEGPEITGTGPLTVVFVREADDKVSVYVNGVLHVDAFDDSLGKTSELMEGAVSFFRDQKGSGVTDEESSGQVQRIRMFDTALTPAQVAGVSGCVPPPRCGGRRATIVGNARANVLAGTPGRDVISSLGGNDYVIGRGGNDSICTGKGRDRAFGLTGRDVIRLGPGNDRAFGGPGGDRLLGGPGLDRLFGQAGPDRLFGQNGRDRLFGAAGNDLLDGGQLSDRCVGGLGRDRLRRC